MGYERTKETREASIAAAIITTTANAVMERLHNRMPVILPDDAIEEWLDPEAITRISSSCSSR